MKSSEIVNNLRIVGTETITHAKSGHPGVVLSAAPIFYSVFKNLKTDKNNLKYFNRDFFVNSAGHSSALNYACMNLFDMGITKQDLLNFRTLNSKTPGHPEISTGGIDCSTGPLGQGVANAVGISISQKHFAKIFNKKDFKIFDSVTFCFVGDGCMMEGVSLEAFSLAGSLKLNNLIVIYDRNRKTIEGDISTTFCDDIFLKFKAMNFNVYHVKNGNNADLIEKAILKAKKSKNKPNLIVVDTLIGYGSHVEDSEVSHGKPFTEEEILKLKNKLNMQNEFLEFNKDVQDFVNKIVENRQNLIKEEKLRLEKYEQKFPDEYRKLNQFFEFGFNKVAVKHLEKFNKKNNLSTRENNHLILNNISHDVLNFMGGSADVNTSSMVFLENEGYLNENFANRNIHFGIREHSMAAISNGIALFGGMSAFCSCYLSFSDYLKPSLRMSALMNLPVLYEFSHDNFLIGEDGPTHQPVEQMVMLRATPNLAVFRPYNISEILACYKYFLQTKKPTAIVLSKEKVENKKSKISDCLKGGYVIFREIEPLKAVILTSGMETQIAINVAKKLKNIRVVSMPCFELFDKQSKKYQESVLTTKPKIALEFSSSYSYYKYVSNGLYLCQDSFGRSGKGKDIQKYFKLDENNIIKKIKKFLKNIE